MKSRDYDTPVKIIQILPVDNKLSKQPLKPQRPLDFSSMGRPVVEVSRQAAAWMKAASIRVREEIERHVSTTGPIPMTSSGAGSEETASSGAQLKTVEAVRQPAMPERLPNIVVCDLVPIDVFPPTCEFEPDPVERAIQPAGEAHHRRILHQKAGLVERWLYERDEIDVVRTAALERVRSFGDAVRQTLVGARRGLLKTWPALAAIFSRPKPQTVEIAALDPDRTVVQELTHELIVTKTTLLAQHHALENVSVQLSAVQKELARHKHLLSGLVTQVEAVDLKIVRTTQVTARRTRLAEESGPEACKAYQQPRVQSAFEGGEPLPEADPTRTKPASPRRPLAKKPALGAGERAREHRA